MGNDVEQATVLDVFKKLFLRYFFLTVLGLHCCRLVFASCSEQGLLFLAMHGLLLLQSASSRCGLRELKVAGFGSWRSWALGCRLSSCGTWAGCSLACGSSGTRYELMSYVLAGRLSSTVQPGKSWMLQSEWILTIQWTPKGKQTGY